MGGSRASSSTELDECTSKHILCYTVVFIFIISPVDDERMGLSSLSTPGGHYSPVDGERRGRSASSTPGGHYSPVDGERRSSSFSSTPGGHSRASSTGGGAGIDM